MRRGCLEIRRGSRGAPAPSGAAHSDFDGRCWTSWAGSSLSGLCPAGDILTLPAMGNRHWPTLSCDWDLSSLTIGPPSATAVPRGVVGFEVDPRCLLAAVDRGDAASIAGWFEFGHGPLGQVVALA